MSQKTKIASPINTDISFFVTRRDQGSLEFAIKKDLRTIKQTMNKTSKLRRKHSQQDMMTSVASNNAPLGSGRIQHQLAIISPTSNFFEPKQLGNTLI